MAPALTPRRRGTASATKRSWDVMKLNKVGVVEEEEGMGRGEVDVIVID